MCAPIPESLIYLITKVVSAGNADEKGPYLEIMRHAAPAALPGPQGRHLIAAAVRPWITIPIDRASAEGAALQDSLCRRLRGDRFMAHGIEFATDHVAPSALPGFIELAIHGLTAAAIQ